MAGKCGTFIVCTLLLTALQVSLCGANTCEIELSNFTLSKIEPGKYQAGKNTTVTFRADLTYQGSHHVEGTAETIQIVFVVLSLNNGATTVGRVRLPMHQIRALRESRSIRIENTTQVEIPRNTCNNNEADWKLCAGVTCNVGDDLALMNNCIKFGTDINDGGAGEINCEHQHGEGPIQIPWYAILLLVIVHILIIAIIICLCRRQWIKRRGRAPPGEEANVADYLSQPRKSLQHIYEDISNRLANVHLPLRRRSDNDQGNNYEIRLSRGKDNDGFDEVATVNETDSQDGTGTKNFVLEVEDRAAESTSTPSSTPGKRSIFVKRSSQPNEYILDDVGPSNPDWLRNRAPSVDIPLRNAPDVPPDPDDDTLSDRNPDSDEDPIGPTTSVCDVVADDDQVDSDFGSDFGSDPSLYPSPYLVGNQKTGPVHKPTPDPDSDAKPDSDHKISSMDSLQVSSGLPDSRTNSYPDLDSDPGQISDPIKNSSPELKPKPALPPKRSQKPLLNKNSDSDKLPDSHPNASRPQTRSTPAPNPSPDGSSLEVTPGAQKSFSMEDHISKPTLPPKPSRGSGHDTDQSEEANVPARRPQLPEKPRRLSHTSEPGTPHEDKSAQDWSSSSTSSLPEQPRRPSRTSEPSSPTPRPSSRQQPATLSVYKPPLDTVDVSKIASSPSLKPKIPKSPSASIKSTVDEQMMHLAYRKVRDSTVKLPNPDELDPQRQSSQSDIDSAFIPLSPTDPEFMKTIMETYLALMYEMSKGDDDYEDALQREKKKLESDAPVTDYRTLTRRKSYGAQLALNKQKRKTVYSGVYVNQWNKSWELQREHLDVDREKPLGEGQFGKVYKAIAKGVRGRGGSTLVAVKELKDGATTDDKDEFLKELAIHAIMKTHPHVVELLGCCIRDEPICIITEYLSGGNLLGFLRDKPTTQTGRDVVRHYVAKFGLHIARGMAYVSQLEIVHRDLAARNILISEEEVCKVSDFGFARDIFGVPYYPRAPEKAPIRWYAPESILDNMFSTKSDVWSFGVLLFEIATLGRVAPYHGNGNEEVRIKVSAGMHPKRPPYCDNALFDLMKQCWAKSAEDRPSFSELVGIFEDIQSLYPGPSKVEDDEVLNDEEEECSF